MGLQRAYVLFMVSSMVGEVEIQAVDGPSAGAAATIATVAAIENKRVKGDVIITGTIGEDHKIGDVGEVAAKAKAPTTLELASSSSQRASMIPTCKTTRLSKGGKYKSRK